MFPLIGVGRSFRWLGLGLGLLAGLSVASGSSGASSQPASATASNAAASVIVVVGAPGDDEYATKFNEWAGRWQKASHEAGARWAAVGYGKEASTNESILFRELLEKEPKNGSGDLWIVFLGHGTYDGRESKFNLRGPDISATELAKWLEPFKRPTAVIAAFASSAPFLSKLSAQGRVVLTATRSGHEQNYSRFGEYISGAVADPAADLDKDGQTSLLEAFLMASRRTAEFYETEGRLATEHPLLDDNGDSLGTPPSWFRGVRATKKAKEGAPLDGIRAHQFHLVRNDAERQLPPEIRAKRDDLELAIAKLRESKATMDEDAYYEKLESLALQMAELYEKSARPSATPK